MKTHAVVPSVIFTIGSLTHFVALADDAADERFYESKVRPLLARHCWECHSEKKQQAGLRLDSRDAMIKGSDNGAVVASGRPNESRLIEVVLYDPLDVQMPPDGKLPNDDIAILKEWIERGTPWPNSEPEDSTDGVYDFASARRDHWAFRPIGNPAPPEVQQASWPQTPIDRFILARWESAKLQPASRADRYTLLRRATFDLTGLPPTWEEMQTFLNDPADDVTAFAKVIDRLLASPAYGERWGRHWLDVARYADTKGYVFNTETRYPFAYTYRDYVIRAFNDDQPYDQFLSEQIAADQLPREDDRSLAALGFLTVGRRFRNSEPDIIDDRIDVVTRGLMGLTVSCARCHDHKYDPIPTADYYSLYGVFASCEEPSELPLIAEPEQTPEYREFSEELAKRREKVAEHIRAHHRKLVNEFRTRVGDYLAMVVKQSSESNDDYGLSFSEGDPRPQMVVRWKRYLAEVAKPEHPVFGPWRLLAELPTDQFADRAPQLIADWQRNSRFNSVVLQALAAKPPKNLYEVASVYGDVLQQVHNAWTEYSGLNSLATELPEPPVEQLRQILYAPDTPTALTEAESRRLFDRVARNKLRQLESQVEKWKINSPVAPPRAMVLIDKNRPVEPRVFLRGNKNRLGGVVPRRFPQILAGEESASFQDGSGRLELARAIADPNNPLTARVMVNRIWMHHFTEGLVATEDDFGFRSDPPTHPELLDWLAAEFIRSGWSVKRMHRMILSSAVYRQAGGMRVDDAWMNHAAQIDPENRLLWRFPRRRLGFEAMRDSLLSASGRLNRQQYGRPVDSISSADSTRRTVYGFVDRNNFPNLHRTFDFANPDASTAQRATTTVPQQSLFAMNSPFVVAQVKSLARHPELTTSENMAGRITALYRRVYARNPSAEEVSLGLNYLETADSAGDLSPWERYVQVLLLSNEFLFVD